MSATPNGNNMTVRRATLRDWKEILDIDRDIYQGLDYIPAFLEDYLNDKDCICYVGEINGKIIAFTAHRITDGGVTSVDVAKRINPKYAGQNYLLYIRNIQDLKSNSVLVKIQRNNNTKVLTSKEALEVLADKWNLVHLFPSGYIISECWFIHRPFYQNMQKLAKNHRTVCTANPDSPSRVDAMSFSFFCKVPLGLRVDIYYYETKCTSKELLYNHIIDHLKHIAETASEGTKLGLILHFPLQHDVQDLKDALKGIIGESVKTETFRSERAVAQEVYVLPNDAKANL